MKLTLKTRFYYGVGCFTFISIVGLIGFLIKLIPRSISTEAWHIKEYLVMVIIVSLIVGIIGAITGPKIFSS